MRVSKEALALSVVVRRVHIGATPFGWEVHRTGASRPVQVSAERFRSMEAAYQAGPAILIMPPVSPDIPLLQLANSLCEADFQDFVRS